MSHSPVGRAESLRIGTVDFVSPDEIKVLLDIEAPESVALNPGGPRPFPRVHGYVLIPVDDAFLVGQIEWLTVERSAYPHRRGMQDFGLIDLPYPLRKMSLNPLGTLRKGASRLEDEELYKFERGTDSFPTIGTSVLLPTDTQLRSIVESGKVRRIKIGTSPLASNAEVKVDPDRLFGRHLAVLGNTGSGKSCSVAGLIRWSLEQAYAEKGSTPNARFIILDPNGEYTKAFEQESPGVKARVFKVEPAVGEKLLKVPLWFWNSAEWCCFTQASPRAQRPTLIQALASVRDGEVVPEPNRPQAIRRFLRTIVSAMRMEKSKGTPWLGYPRPMSFFHKIEKWNQGLNPELAGLAGEQLATLTALTGAIETLCVPRRSPHPNWDFTLPEVENLITLASAAHAAFGGSEGDIMPIDVDAPRTFTGDDLVRAVEATAEMLDLSEYAETLLVRIRGLLANARMKPIIADGGDQSLEKWLADYVGTNGRDDGCISILDVSLVPSEVIHVITAVVARITFEALQRYRKLKGKTLPTVLVMEEAHTFIKRYKEHSENQDAATVCCQVFERIAREGRKFGLGLVVSSQRPSEMSPTVISQCNSFLLHRISNDQDQKLVNCLVPDNLRGLLRELPSLPSQNAILLGWASELPIMVKMNDLPRNQQPHSHDPDFWHVWTGKDEQGDPVAREADWAAVAADWVAPPSLADEPTVAPDEDIPF